VWQYPVLQRREEDIDVPCRRGSSEGTALAFVEGAAALLELPLLADDAQMIADILSGLQRRIPSIPQQDAERSSTAIPGAPW
jgi:hypothetical protein